MLPNQSRTAIQRAIKSGDITINGQRVKPRQTVTADDQVEINIPINASGIVTPTPITVPKLFEDNDVVVINKPAGVLAHAGMGSTAATISDWLVRHFPAAAGVGGQPERSGIVHRLDQNTSGAMILAKNSTASAHLKEMWSRHRVKKEYLALVYGCPNDTDGRIVQSIARSRRNPMRRTIDANGKPAITHWQREQILTDPVTNIAYCLLRAFPLSGRMHQLRVHLHWLGFPIVGDSLYTFKRQRPPQGVRRQLLHAHKLTVELPNGPRHTFTAPIARDFQTVLDSLTATSA